MTDSPRSYSLYQTFTSRMQTIGGPVLVLVGAFVAVAFSAVSFVNGGQRAAEPLPLFLVMAVGSAVMLYWLLRMPSAIEWRGDGAIHFKGPIRTVVVSVSAIESIRPYGIGFLTLRYSGRKLVLLNQFDEFHEFLWRLRQANPGIQLRGC